MDVLYEENAKLMKENQRLSLNTANAEMFGEEYYDKQREIIAKQKKMIDDELNKDSPAVQALKKEN